MAVTTNFTNARADCISRGGDLAVIGFDDIDMARWTCFDLTTVRNPIDAAVREILRLLEARLGDPGKADETVFVDPVVKPRGTH